MTPPALAAEPIRQHAKILIVDDEAGLRALLSGELAEQGHTVQTVSDGQEALDRLKHERFHLVICDINMPRLGGVELLQRMRSQHPDTDVIMMTGYGTLEVAVHAMKEGAYDFIQKPFDLSEMVVLVEKCLERKDLKAMNALYLASQSIFRSVKIQELLPVIGDLALTMFSADDVAIYLSIGSDKLLTAHAEGLSYTRDVAQLAMIRHLVTHGDLGDMPLDLTPPFEESPLKELPAPEFFSALVCPLTMDGRFLGALVAGRTIHQEAFQTSDLRRASILSSQISQAVYNASLYRQLNETIQGLRKANDQIQTMQEELIQAEKLASVGRLAAGVAHELNNPLSGVLGFTQLLIENSKTMTDQQRSDLQTIYTQGKRCQTIIQNMLKFSRRTELKTKPLQVATLLNSTLELARYQFANSPIDLVLNCPATLPEISGDAVQLQQVFLNLLSNAQQALDGAENPSIILEARQEGQKIVISVADNGCGIPKKILDKIFDPFFTTKSVGQGTGLGLSICDGIIKQHQGVIRVKSTLEKGTTFTVELPVLHAETSTPEAAA